MSGRAPVQLSGEERALAHALAKRRLGYTANRNARRLGKDPLQAELLGAVGEIGARKHYRMPMPPVSSADRHDPGFDLRLGSYKANVKACPYFRDPILKVEPHLSKNADVYVLVCVEASAGYCEIAGWCTRTYLQSKPLERLRPHLPVCRMVREEELRRPRIAAEDEEDTDTEKWTMEPYTDDTDVLEPREGTDLVEHYLEVFEDPRLADLFR